MSGFDDPGIFYSDSFGGDPGAEEGQARKSQLQRRFKEFLRQYRVGTDRTGFTFKYRDELKRHYNLGEYWIEVEMEDLASFDEELADHLHKQPAEHLQLLEEAAKEVADEVTRPRPAGDELLQDIQVMLKSDASPSSIRILKSDMMSHLVKIPGIIISASAVRAKATRISIQCRSCHNTLTNIAMRPGLEGYALPRKCNMDQAGRPKCPLDPYFIMPDKCKCVDFQTLKLQELPDAVPHGEMPRHMQLYCDRYLCDKVVPGNRVTIMGIYSIKKFGLNPSKGRDRVGVGLWSLPGWCSCSTWRGRSRRALCCGARMELNPSSVALHRALRWSSQIHVMQGAHCFPLQTYALQLVLKGTSNLTLWQVAELEDACI